MTGKPTLPLRNCMQAALDATFVDIDHATHGIHKSSRLCSS